MKERYIPALVMLIAGTITSILNVVNKVEVLEGLKRLLAVLLLFYFAGLIVKAVIIKTIINAPRKGDEIQEEAIEDTEEEQPEKA